MEFNAAEWQKEIGRPVPPLMARFFEWLTQFDYGDLGYFDLAPENLAHSSGWDDIEHWGPMTWGFMRLPEGSVIALCEAVEPAAVVYAGSEGELKTLAESFEAFLLAWALGEDLDVDELCVMGAEEEPEEQQIEAFRAFKAWLKKSKIKAPEVSGSFDFSAYACGDEPLRLQPGKVPSTAPVFSERYTALAQQLGPAFRALCDLLGRTADDADIAVATQQLFGKAPPLSIGNAKHDDTEGLYHKKVAFEIQFSRNVRNLKYPPVAIGKKAICPYLSRIYVKENYTEPLLFGLQGDAMWQEIKRCFPDDVEIVTDDDGQTEAQLSLLIDEQRGIELVLWTTGEGTRGYAAIAEGRELEYPEAAQEIHSGAGLFAQWVLENGWLERAMFAGHEGVLDAMAQRQARPSQLAQVAFGRGLWDTHLSDVPGLRDFAHSYFHHFGGFWITKDLIDLFGKREGRYGHDEPILDDDSPDIYEKVFARFNVQFEAYKKAHPDRVS